MTNKEDLIKKGYRIFELSRANEIYYYLLTGEYTATEVSKLIFPDLYKKQAKKEFRKRPHTVVVRFIGAFNEFGWLKTKGDTEDNRKTKIKATYKPYFEYLRHKNPKIKLSKDEINFIIKDWLNDFTPDKNNLYTSLDNFIKQNYIDSYLREIFVLNKVELKERLKKDLTGEEIIFIKLGKILYDKFTLELIINYLKYLLKDLNKNSEMSVHIKKMIGLFEK